MTVLHRGRTVRTFRAVIGARSTPTPKGRFFVEENVRLGSSRVGAPYALALSARSGVLQQFAGGPGQIALHGLGNVGGDSEKLGRVDRGGMGTGGGKK